MDRDIVIEIIDRFSSKNIHKLKIIDGDFSIELDKAVLEQSEITSNVIMDKPLESNFQEVKSPLVGMYYEALNPEMEPFVKVGDRVAEGDTLFIIEAMKMINEIPSPYSGVVKKIYFKNEDLIQYDDLVMEIDTHV